MDYPHPGMTSSCYNKQLSLTQVAISVLMESCVVKLISKLLLGPSTFYLSLLLVPTSMVLVYDLGVKLLLLDLTDHEPQVCYKERHNPTRPINWICYFPSMFTKLQL